MSASCHKKTALAAAVIIGSVAACMVDAQTRNEVQP